MLVVNMLAANMLVAKILVSNMSSFRHVSRSSASSEALDIHIGVTDSYGHRHEVGSIGSD